MNTSKQTDIASITCVSPEPRRQLFGKSLHSLPVTVHHSLLTRLWNVKSVLTRNFTRWFTGVAALLLRGEGALLARLVLFCFPSESFRYSRGKSGCLFCQSRSRAGWALGRHLGFDGSPPTHTHTHTFMFTSLQRTSQLPTGTGASIMCECSGCLIPPASQHFTF